MIHMSQSLLIYASKDFTILLRAHGDLIEDFQLLMYVVWHAFGEQMHVLQRE